MTTEESIYVDIIEEKIPPTSVLITNAPVELDIGTHREIGSLMFHNGNVLRFISITNVRDRIEQAKAYRKAGCIINYLAPNLLAKARDYVKA